jgi:hypothetical protein
MATCGARAAACDAGDRVSPQPNARPLGVPRDWWRQGLKDAGFVIGQNVEVEYRWANNQFERLPTLAADLVQSKVAVIVTGGGPVTALAALPAPGEWPTGFRERTK